MTPSERARQLLGVKWLHQGRDPAVGIDCLYLAMYAHDVDPAEEPMAYSRNPHNGLLTERLVARLGPAATDGIRVDDTVELAWGRQSRHVGIVGAYAHGGLSLIHCDSMVGRVVEHSIDAKWLRRIVGVYRHE